MKRSDLLSSFTPSTMSPETLEAMFVKREPLAREIVGSITHSAATGGRQHHIAVGPRGIGKTHLVSLVTYRLLTDPVFLDQAVIAWLREEEWGIGSIGELYEAILMQLASDDTPILAVHQAARSAVDQLAGCSLDDLPDKAETLLTQVLSGRMLVVVVENLDLLFDSIGPDDQHRLRAYLQNERNTVLLASTPSLSESIAQRDGLFFGFFAIHHLDELTIDEARALLQNIAGLRDDEEGRRLTEYLKTDEATRRLQTVQALAGGHPRLWVLMAECITTERLEEVVGLLLAVLDDLTPYYQSQMAALTPQQRKIVTVLSRADGALTPKEIAARTRIQERSVAKQLGDLQRLRFVRLAVLPNGVPKKDKRLRPYEVQEPLLRHVLEVKESRGRPLTLIVQFLRTWYERPQLERWAVSGSPVVAGYAAAALRLLTTTPFDARPAWLSEELAQVLTEGSPEEALGLLSTIRRTHPGDLEALIAHTMILAAVGDRDAAQRQVDEILQVAPHEAFAFVIRAGCHLEDGDSEAALEAANKAVEFSPESTIAHELRGTAMLRLGNQLDALHEFDRTIRLGEADSDVHVRRGVALLELERFEEALDAFDDALELNPDQLFVFNNIGLAFAAMGRWADALEAYDTAESRTPTDPQPKFNRLLALAGAGQAVEDAVLEKALGSTTDPDFLDLNLRWLVDAFEAQASSEVQTTNVSRLVRAASLGTAMSSLLEALLVNLTEVSPRDPSALTTRSTWFDLWSRELGAPAPVMSEVLAACSRYVTTQDGASLLALRTEARPVAYRILGLETLLPGAEQVEGDEDSSIRRPSFSRGEEVAQEVDEGAGEVGGLGEG